VILLADEKTVKQITEQVLEILVYLQKLVPPVIHRDIKPQNIIRSGDGKIFLVDFGAVQDIYHHTSIESTVAGTYGYMAPEQFRGQAFLSTDLYGLGTTLLFLLTGQIPSELPEKRLKIDFRNSVQISSEFADWIDKLIEPSNRDRLPSAEAALKVLQGKQSLHTYIRQQQPKYTSVNITKTEEKLFITIPPALFYKKCDRINIFSVLIWYVVLILIFVGTSASELGILSLLCASFLIVEIVTVDEVAIIFRAFQWMFLLMPSPFILLLSLAGHFSLGFFSHSILISYLLLLLDLAFIAESRISIARNIFFTTCLQVYSEQQIKVSRKIFNIDLVEIVFKNKQFKIKNLYNSSLILIYSDLTKKKPRNYEFGSLLTNAEKDWIFEEIKKQIEQGGDRTIF
jgi:serine/threonine protein kinase